MKRIILEPETNRRRPHTKGAQDLYLTKILCLSKNIAGGPIPTKGAQDRTCIKKVPFMSHKKPPEAAYQRSIGLLSKKNMLSQKMPPEAAYQRSKGLLPKQVSF